MVSQSFETKWAITIVLVKKLFLANGAQIEPLCPESALVFCHLSGLACGI